MFFAENAIFLKVFNVFDPKIQLSLRFSKFFNLEMQFSSRFSMFAKSKVCMHLCMADGDIVGSPTFV